MFEHKPFTKQLTGHNSEDTAYIVEDYPYGFRLRTTIRYWIETTKQGQRRVSQTKNPKNGRWNTPKKSTYSTISVMGLDEIGHVTFDGIGFYATEAEALTFEKCFELDDYQKKELLFILGSARGQKFVKYTCGAVTDDSPRQTEEEQREILKRATRAGLTEIIRERSRPAIYSVSADETGIHFDTTP